MIGFSNFGTLPAMRWVTIRKLPVVFFLLGCTSAVAQHPSSIAPECDSIGTISYSHRAEAILDAGRVIERLGGHDAWRDKSSEDAEILIGEYATLYMSFNRYSEMQKRLIECLLNIIEKGRGEFL